MVSLSVDAREGAESLLTGVRRGTPTTAEGGIVICLPNRALWFSAGFLLGVVITVLAMLWMMTMAVIA